jgi:predicted dehydrogenase
MASLRRLDSVVTMRIGLIGAGYMAGLHARAWAQMGDVVVAAVAARPGSAASLASTLGAASSSTREILDDPTIEAVDVTVPTALHSEIVGASLDAGKHVLCETPLAHDAASADRMVSRARERGRSRWPSFIASRSSRSTCVAPSSTALSGGRGS